MPGGNDQRIRNRDVVQLGSWLEEPVTPDRMAAAQTRSRSNHEDQETVLAIRDT